MRNKMFKAIMDLQLFAEGGDAGAGGNGDGGAAGDGAGNNGAGSGDGGDGTLSFDDFLSQKGNQAEFDRRVQKAIDTAVSNAKSKWQAIHDDKLSEAEKLAKMTSEEKSAYRMSQLEKEVAEFKKKEAISQMTSTARNMLSDEGINVPDSLISHLVTADAEETKKAVEEFAELFKNAVQDAVKDKLKGKPPKKGTGGSITRDQIYAIKDPSERQRMIAEHMELFES